VLRGDVFTMLGASHSHASRLLHLQAVNGIFNHRIGIKGYAINHSEMVINKKLITPMALNEYSIITRIDYSFQFKEF